MYGARHSKSTLLRVDLRHVRGTALIVDEVEEGSVVADFPRVRELDVAGRVVVANRGENAMVQLHCELHVKVPLALARGDNGVEFPQCLAHRARLDIREWVGGDDVFEVCLSQFQQVVREMAVDVINLSVASLNFACDIVRVPIIEARDVLELIGIWLKPTAERGEVLVKMKRGRINVIFKDKMVEIVFMAIFLIEIVEVQVERLLARQPRVLDTGDGSFDG